MNIHEYQAKALLRQYGAPVSDGRVVMKADEAKTAAGELDGPLWVVKAQIHAGGRGKGHFKEKEAGEKGGVRLAKSVSEAEELTRQMLGRTLVTHQTGATGKQVNRIYIEDGSDIERELYLAAENDLGTILGHIEQLSPSLLVLDSVQTVQAQGTDGVAGGDGLDCIRAIVDGASAHLQPGGWLLMEHGYDQAVQVRELLAAAGFGHVLGALASKRKTVRQLDDASADRKSVV